MPSKMANGLSKKYNQFTSKTNKVPLPEEQATESRKPLIAKWKPGAKLQVTGRQSESDGKYKACVIYFIKIISDTNNL